MGHLIAALVLGVPLNKIKIAFDGINPGFKILDVLGSTALAIYQYAGGVFAAAVCLCIYLFLWLRKYRSRPTLLGWIVGLYCWESVEKKSETLWLKAISMPHTCIMQIPLLPNYFDNGCFYGYGVVYFIFSFFPFRNLKRKPETVSNVEVRLDNGVLRYR